MFRECVFFVSLSLITDVKERFVKRFRFVDVRPRGRPMSNLELESPPQPPPHPAPPPLSRGGSRGEGVCQPPVKLHLDGARGGRGGSSVLL